MTTLKTFNDKFSLRINKWNDRQHGLKPCWEILMGKYTLKNTFYKFIIASNSPWYHTMSSQLSGNVNLNCILKSTLCVYGKWAWQGNLSPLRKLTGSALWCSTLIVFVWKPIASAKISSSLLYFNLANDKTASQLTPCKARESLAKQITILWSQRGLTK